MALTDADKDLIGKLPIYNDKVKLEERVQDETAKISRERGDTCNKQNPQSFIMNSYATLSSAVGEKAVKKIRQVTKPPPVQALAPNQTNLVTMS